MRGLHVYIHACMLCLLPQGDNGPEGALLACFSKATAPWIESLLAWFLEGLLSGLPFLPSLLVDPALGFDEGVPSL